MKDNNEMGYFALIVLGVGAVVGIGKLLQSDERITARLMAGRALTTAVLALGAFSIGVMIPDVDPVYIVGVSAVIASLGEQGLERVLNKYTSKGGSQ
ncbi:hypothetical protein [Thiothrix sp.]|jgi:arginine/ornithine N-succinyltransferase beta subunit|uniref:hypothetical protein n=1 Tax=Thiothrix sp. TaxID=1032 RepID=UPI002579D434|nr:hypothetical protein [Thiothrix sp.]